MKKLISMGGLALAAILGLVACGGSGNTLVGGGGGGGVAEVATVTVLAASPQLPSDQTGLTNVQVTAQVKDVNNAVLAEVPVSFSATSGSLAVTQPTTNDAGFAIAQLSNGTNPANRAITVQAVADGIAGSVTINVTGSTVSITGPTALSSGEVGNFVASVRDSKGVGVPGSSVTVTSANGNTLSVPSLTTDGTGNIGFTVTATQPGADTITVSALGIAATATINVSGDVFTFTTPPAGTEINIGASQTLSVRWTKNGVPQVGELIDFSRTRGTITGGDVTATRDTTDANGVATVSISATSAGPSVISAAIFKPGFPDNGVTATRAIEFVSVTPATLELQASPLTVATGAQSELLAIVRDSNNNVVKNQVVQFVIEQDNSGGSSLSVGSDVTDSQGRAQSVYTGGSSQTAANGVVIRAVVAGTAVDDTVSLTVARQELFITLGTGNTLFEIGTATYAKEWAILVTDVDGNAVANRRVQTAIRSRRFWKGELTYLDPVWGFNATSPAPPAGCFDEDTNKNGILEPGEDVNGNGIIEAGNIALVAAVPESAPLDNPCATAGAAGVAADVFTNSQGRARVCVFYLQNYALWLEAALTAKASVSGTEFSRTSVFTLDVLSDDIDDEEVTPPNVLSPFGRSTEPDGGGGTRPATCADPPPGA